MAKSYNKLNSISTGWNIVLSLLLIFAAAITVAPVLLVVSVSLTASTSLTEYGYKFIPREWTIDAYKYLWHQGRQIVIGYKVTVSYTLINTVLSLLIMSMYSYVLAQKGFRHRKFFTFIGFFTMLFSGGMVPSYIFNVKYYGLYNSFLIFVVGGLFSFYNCVILRTFLTTTIPDSLFEAARIDGAGHVRIYWQIVMPLFKAGLATIGLFKVVGCWNDYFTGMLYIDDPKLVPLATMLTKILNNIDYVKNNSQNMSTQEIEALIGKMPTEAARMAIAVVSTAPILMAYPFFQRYFVQGLTIGSVKG